jgi:hypothetical protein
MKGLNENDSIQKLDLSDNSIKDTDGIHIVRYLKLQSEKRENALWMTGLRHHSDQDSFITDKSLMSD